MDLDALDKTLAKDGPRPIYLIQGAELWSVDEAARRVLKASVADPNDPMSVTRLDMADGKRAAKDVVGACRALGLFTSRLAVIVRAAERLDRKAADREELLSYCQAPVSATTLILKVHLSDGGGRGAKTKGFDQRTSLVKAIKKHGVVLNYDPLKPYQAEAWLADRFRQLGHRVEASVTRRVVELSGPNILALQQISEQLSLFAGPGQGITVADVEEALVATREHSIFELVDAVTDSDRRAILRHVHAMLEQRQSPFAIMASVIRHYRQLAQALDVTREGGRADAIQQRLKVHPFVAKKLAAQAPRFDPRLLRKSFEAFARADLQVKTSRVDDGVILEQLLLGLAEASSRDRQGRSGARAR